MRAPSPGREPRQSPDTSPTIATGATVAAADEPTDRYLRKREDILAAAALTFNELGIGGGTLSGIAQRVGLATNSVTYYFRRKEDLVAACFLRAIAVHLEDIREAAREPTVAARVETCLARQAALLADIATGATSRARRVRNCTGSIPTCSARCGACWWGRRPRGSPGRT
jgi:AcrR family transcriptional regulator